MIRLPSLLKETPGYEAVLRLVQNDFNFQCKGKMPSLSWPCYSRNLPFRCYSEQNYPKWNWLAINLRMESVQSAIRVRMNGNCLLITIINKLAFPAKLNNDVIMSLSNKSVTCFEGDLLVTLSDSHGTCHSYASRSNNRNIWFGNHGSTRLNEMKNRYLF